MRKYFLPILAALLSFGASASKPFSHGPSSGNEKKSLKEGDYVPGTIILKMKEATRTSCQASDISISTIKVKFAALSSTGVEKRFPRAIVPSLLRSRSGQPLVDLSLIYTVK